MTKRIFAAVLGFGMACAGPALAERWVEPVNGTVSAVMMPDGAVMMQVQIPQKEFLGIGRDMKAGHDVCTIKEISPDATNTMILVCGGG